VRIDSGVRAQAVKANVSLVDDFVFERRGRQMHVLNAPPPAATASLGTADFVGPEIIGLGPRSDKPWFAAERRNRKIS